MDPGEVFYLQASTKIKGGAKFVYNYKACCDGDEFLQLIFYTDEDVKNIKLLSKLFWFSTIMPHFLWWYVNWVD